MTRLMIWLTSPGYIWIPMASAFTCFCNFVSLKWAGWCARWMALTWPWSQYLWRCWSLHVNVAVYSVKFKFRPVHLNTLLDSDWFSIWKLRMAYDWRFSLSLQMTHRLSITCLWMLVKPWNMKQHWDHSDIPVNCDTIYHYMILYKWHVLGLFHLSLIQVLGVARRRSSHPYHEPTCWHCVPRCHVVQIGRGRVWNEYDMSTTESSCEHDWSCQYDS